MKIYIFFLTSENLYYVCYIFFERYYMYFFLTNICYIVSLKKISTVYYDIKVQTIYYLYL